MKQGFTLIELLAVIVILAIIALIATPIVLNIIEETKESANLRSAEMYLEAVEISVATSTFNNKKISNGTYNILENGNICLNYEDDKCTDELKVEVDGEVPSVGSTIILTNGQIINALLKMNDKEIARNSKGEILYVKKLDEVCTYQDNGVSEKTIGAKYKCKVDPNKEPYTFYVLTTPTSVDTRINLIMASNINSDGSPAIMTRVSKSTNPSKYNIVPWISKEDYLKPEVGGTEEEWHSKLNENGNWNKGPITAMNFLQEATKNWTNTNEMKIDTFNDETGTYYTMKTYYTYARMPIYLSDPTKTEVSDWTTRSYLYENLSPDGISDYQEGYMTLSADSSNYTGVWYVDYTGDVFAAGSNGVRPVINLNL